MVEYSIFFIFPKTLNTGFVSSGASVTSWGEGASLALAAHPTLLPIDKLRTPSFPMGLVKTEFGFNVRSVETGLGR